MPESKNAAAELIYKTDIIVIGAGQAGLSSAYYLMQQGIVEGRGFVIVDQSPRQAERGSIGGLRLRLAQ